MYDWAFVVVGEAESERDAGDECERGDAFCSSICDGCEEWLMGQSLEIKNALFCEVL